MRTLAPATVPAAQRSVRAEALALPEVERAPVAAELLANISDPAAEYSAEAADDFAREVGRRVERVVSGESVGIDCELTQRLLDEELARG